MRFVTLPVEGARLVDPELKRDERGFFARLWCSQEFEREGLSGNFVQGSVSYNEIAGTLRGMHYQADPHPEIKLVRCSAGSIYDVIVDLRPQSKTYLRWCGEQLSAENRRALYIPAGCAHGFITLEDRSEVVYEISEFFFPESSRGVRWDDPAFGIVWPRKPARISDRDANYPLLGDRRP